MSVPLELPRVYPILDVECLSETPSAEDGSRLALLNRVADFARELMAGGATLLQYRNKRGSPREMLSHARELRRIAPGVRLIMNDRADLCLAAGFDGVHVGQDDLSPGGARLVVGTGRWVGVSTHNVEQVRESDGWPVDYVAIGPVYGTRSKANPDPVVGLEGVRAARGLTRKALVAIGGITLENCREVIEAGADSVAVISCLADSPRQTIAGFLRTLS